MNIKECIMKNCSAHVIFPWRVLYDNHHSYLIVREIPKEYEAFKFHQVTKRKVSLTRLCSVQRKYVLVMILQHKFLFSKLKCLFEFVAMTLEHSLIYNSLIKTQHFRDVFQDYGNEKTGTMLRKKKSLSFTSHLQISY